MSCVYMAASVYLHNPHEYMTIHLGQEAAPVVIHMSAHQVGVPS